MIMIHNRASRRNALLMALGLAASSLLSFHSFSWWAKAKYVPTHGQYVTMGLYYLCINLIYIYLVATNLIRDNNNDNRHSFGYILIISCPFLLIAFLSYPTTNDIYNYLHYGLMVLNGVNPYLTPASSFNSTVSPFLVFQQPSPYGPASQAFFAISAYFTDMGIAAGVYVFKVICLLFHILSSYLIWMQLDRSPLRTTLTTSYVLNPILLFEYVAQAHVDVIMTTATIAALFLITHRKFVLASVMIWLGFLCKTLPIIWLPLLYLHIFRLKRWGGLTAITLLSSLAAIAMSFFVFPSDLSPAISSKNG